MNKWIKAGLKSFIFTTLFLFFQALSEGHAHLMYAIFLYLFVALNVSLISFFIYNYSYKKEWINGLLTMRILMIIISPMAIQTSFFDTAGFSLFNFLYYFFIPTLFFAIPVSLIVVFISKMRYKKSRG